ncbi:hypothetical protein TNCV_3779201 [Trichonephila clavipes]|nr:hypothetical protein TNCV_3779201 [Trichonephila clavipes]
MVQKNEGDTEYDPLLQLYNIPKYGVSDPVISVPDCCAVGPGFESWRRHGWTATAGSDVVQSGRPIFDDFFQHLWPYIGNNTANVVFQMVKRLWLIRIDQ